MRTLFAALRRAVPADLRRALLRTRPGRALADRDAARRPYEPELSRALERIVEPGWTCADVGAHEGRITRLLARLVGPTGEVVAFEAYPGNARALSAALAGEQLEAHVHVENLAVTDGSSPRVWLHPGRDHASAEWNVVGTDVEGRATEAELEVDAVSLDSYFTAGTRLDLVKIDVEGAEDQVLAGMQRVLREVRPTLAIEFHDENGWRARTKLLEAGYDLWSVDGRRLDPVRDVERQYHCLALPSERALDLERPS